MRQSPQNHWATKQPAQLIGNKQKKKKLPIISKNEPWNVAEGGRFYPGKTTVSDGYLKEKGKTRSFPPFALNIGVICYAGMGGKHFGTQSRPFQFPGKKDAAIG